MKPDASLVADSHSRQAYYNFRWTPAIAEDGVCAGILLTAFETTARVISEVRPFSFARTLSSLTPGSISALPHNVEGSFEDAGQRFHDQRVL